jgi:transmembrane sensor
MERKYFRNLTDKERREIKQNIFLRLDLREQAKVRSVTLRKRIIAIAVAASLIAAVALLTLRPAERHNGSKQLVAQTSVGEIRQVMLADGSLVILNPSSSLYSAKGYSSGPREVYLEGNGFFKVKKMTADRNFIVHAGKQSVTVLGTQFNVNTRQDNMEVVLASGAVKVAADNQKIAPEFMKPGDRLSYKANGNDYQRARVDPLLYSPWSEGEWKFRNTPLNEIAQIISQYYNVDIQFNNTEKKDLKMTAVFPVTDLGTLLNVITETLPVTITRQQQRLIIR